ncbi:DUF6203 family protein [Nonomuraea fastidiosa]|jgi:hypothetical protein|uniref:DUF6203 family protein n=1 Tax=Nonomuraea TaxID=83681 RepID=UPI0032533202
MKAFLKLLVARRLAATPLGLAILGAGWILGRRRKRRRAEREGRQPVPQYGRTAQEAARAGRP